MNRRVVRSAALAALALSLAGCGNDNSQTFRGQMLREMVATSFRAKAKPQPFPPATRAQVRALHADVLLVTQPIRHVRAPLTPDAVNGDVVTWRSADGVTISLRNGIVTATRGMGQDIMSALTPDISTIASGTGTVERADYTLNGLEQDKQASFTCFLSDLGTESIDLAQITYRLHHVAETCSGDAPTFTNDYWIGPHNIVRKSRQWLGTAIGYLEIENLTE